jgi:hypothetical protein
MDRDEVQAHLDNIQDDSVFDEDVESIDTNEGHALPEGLQFLQTSTTGYKTGRNPRTIRASYDHRTNVMYVVFWDGTFIYYSDVPPSVWIAFKSVESKGAFLWENGFDKRNGAIYEYGEVDFNSMTPQRAGQIARNVEFARELQGRNDGKQRTKLRQAPTKRGPYFP